MVLWKKGKAEGGDGKFDLEKVIRELQAENEGLKKGNMLLEKRLEALENNLAEKKKKKQR